jgi:hypothetical protein
MNARRAAIGTAVHNGWVVLVTVAAHDGHVDVVDRRRIALIPPGVPDNPFHHESLVLPLPKAVELVRRVETAVRASARAALETLIEELSPSVGVQAITLPELRDVPAALADVLASWKLTCVADRHMYELAVAKAASAVRVPLVSYARGTEFAFGAAAARLSEDAMMTYTRNVRATVGAPWQKDHQLATAAAIGALARRARVTLTNPARA